MRFASDYARATGFHSYAMCGEFTRGSVGARRKAAGNFEAIKKTAEKPSFLCRTHYFAQFFLRVSRHSVSSAGILVLMVLV